MTGSTATTRLTELTDIITTNTKKIEDYFSANGIPGLSFDTSAPGDFPVPTSNQEIQAARRIVVNATQELHDLLVGPRESLRWGAWSVCKSSLLCHHTYIFLDSSLITRYVIPLSTPMHKV
jgi:hypothetical protein